MENKESAAKCGSTAKKDEVMETGTAADSKGSTKDSGESPTKQDNISDSRIGFKNCKKKKKILCFFFF